MPQHYVFADPDALARAAAERLLALGNATIEQRGAFHLALSGGSTPRRLYRVLAEQAMRRRLDWRRAQVYFGDERCVPPDHEDSNYRMAHEALLSHLPISAEQVHRIAGELDPEQAAAAYAAELERQLPTLRLDLVLLGVGSDGHTASLFPGTALLDEQRRLAGAVYVEKLGAWRISLTLPVLNAARHTLVLVSGADKAEVVREALTEQPGDGELPIARLRPQGPVEWFLDQAAAARLPTGDGP